MTKAFRMISTMKCLNQNKKKWFTIFWASLYVETILNSYESWSHIGNIDNNITFRMNKRLGVFSSI